jgi:putative transposase
MAEQKTGKRVRRSRHEWRSLLAKFERSDLDVGAFCRREAISAASLYRWRGLLSAGGEAVVSNSTPAFIDLGTLNSASLARARLDLKLDLGDGLMLHLARH